MNELITVNYDNSDRPTVSGRELHEALGIKTEYAKWFERMTEYGFTEGEDYSTFLTNRSDGMAGKPRTDHQLTINMAKELCMIQRTEKGKQCRQYFISIENAWNSPEAVMSRALKIADRKLLEAQEHVKMLETTVNKQNELLERSKPLVCFANCVKTADTSILVGELAKLLKQNGVDIGQKRLFEWLRNNGYLIKSGSDRNMPTQYSMERGLFEIKETVVSHADGHTSINKTPKCTGKGQIYFINKFIGTAKGA